MGAVSETETEAALAAATASASMAIGHSGVMGGLVWLVKIDRVFGWKNNLGKRRGRGDVLCGCGGAEDREDRGIYGSRRGMFLFCVLPLWISFFSLDFALSPRQQGCKPTSSGTLAMWWRLISLQTSVICTSILERSLVYFL
jgi:hypothetical protein